MPPFENNPPQIRPCQGPCGRMTRNTKMSKAQYPDTVTRVTATHCQSCHKALVNAGDAELPAREAAREARKLALQEERQAAAHRARQAIEVERAARARRRIPRRVGVGQSMVRI
jgi:hypothetical protein